MLLVRGSGVETLPTPMIVSPSPARVLVVEENRDDEMLTLRSLSRCDRSLDVWVARDVGSAVRALGRDGGDEEPPALVVCELKLPPLFVDDLLRHARETPRLARVPFVVLSSSAFEEDRARCLALGASEFALKPVAMDEYVALVCGIVRRWLPPDPSS